MGGVDFYAPIFIRRVDSMVDYDFYKIKYNGDRVDNVNKFNRLAEKAMSSINNHTFNRACHVEDENLLHSVKMTACELVDLLDSYDGVGEVGDLKSKTQGKRSESYFSIADVGGQDAIARQEYSIIYRRLASTGLMYGGR